MKKTSRILVTSMVFLLLTFVFPFGIMANVPSGALDGAQSINGDIIVNGELIESPSPYIRGDEGNIMVPLRAILEALDLAVDWRPTDRSILIDGAVEIWIGDAQYHIDGVPAGDFGPPPEIFGGSTFVSLPFFNFVLSGLQAEVVEGAIVIDALTPTQPSNDTP
jgi:hypothetical protein